MPKALPEDFEEPRGHRFVPEPDKYCSYCDELIEPEHWGKGPCHLCGEWRFLYEK